MNNFSVRLQTEQIMFLYRNSILELNEHEFHTRYELFFSLSEGIELVSESGRRKLRPNTAVIIPKGTFHQFLHTHKDATYPRCVFKFDDIEEWGDLISRKFRKLRLLQCESITENFLKICDVSTSKKSSLEKQILLKSYLAQILIDIDEVNTSNDVTSSVDAVSFLSSITKEAINYIGCNIDKELSLYTIAQSLHISPSHLSHKFKSDMNISLHRFILNKRLIEANLKLSYGIPVMQVAEQCGFRDYSNFYSQYKKRYGHAPSQYQKKRRH